MSDKYPPESGRRRFVKGVVGSASLAGVGTVGASSVDLLTSPTGAGGGPTTFMGIENTAGPAPRAMPMLPIEIDDEGYLKGRYPDTKEVTKQGRTVTIAEEELGGVTYSIEWFQYCGVQGYQGLQPSYDGDNYLRYGSDAPYTWQQEEVSPGDRANIRDFANYETWGNEYGEDGLGKPATLTWRSDGTENTIPVQVLRSTLVQQAVDEGNQWLEAATSRGVMAWLNKCTHFCCVPGFKTATYGNAEDRVYCPCHQSIYNPFSIVEGSFIAFPRPED
ncbi:MAG: ubiquinol-cytochrome c reductase iron-sulfur subunit [Halobacteriaceae archaeon]